MQTPVSKFTRAVLAIAFAVTGCTQATAPQATKESGDSREGLYAASLVPKPADPSTELAQLQRHRGQSKFLNLAYYWDQCPQCRQDQPSQEESKQDGGQSRAEQESDVFKIGAPGSKLLYLMNNYRGLQVVSFAKGVLQPELIGRAAATGNSPDEMYSLPKDRILTIEHVYNWGNADGEDDQIGDPGDPMPMSLRREYVDRSYSRMLVYDVSKPEHPMLKNTIRARGFIVDSRIVGDVLYVASKEGKTGHITSYSLTSASMKEVAHQQLSLKVSDTQNMNILSVEKGGVFSYYLVATLSEKEWGWWDDSSIIEVIDISDAKGTIKPLMAVAVRGVVRERSQTLIKNDTLIVTSNYNIRRPQGLPARIAVETFRLPTRTSEIITENEETYRRLHIERQLQSLSGKQREEMFEKLANDPVLGIRGRFVRAANGTLRKLVNDSIVTVGDGSGLNANLRDVRYQGDLMYAFWVPANEIDPFDLFDISKPEEGVKYLNRLHFDGWIDRAVPITAGGRRFVLGLGWIVPVVNDDSGRRQPQAMMFEIVEQAGKLRAVDVAQLSFEGSNIWTDFNGQDKMVEVRFQGEGKGQILFGASKWDESTYASGGQLVSFDAGAVLSGQYDKVLGKGDFLNGGAEWIRRVFTNPEIDRINSFSDRQLATYDASTSTGSGDLKPISFLELARDMRAYRALTDGALTRGVQIVDSSGWWSSQDSKTELRLVDGAKADSEKSAILDTLVVDGYYLDSLVEAKTKDLLVASIRYGSVLRRNGTYRYTSVVHVTRIAAANGKFVLRGEIEWATTGNDDPEPEGMKRDAPVGTGFDRALVQLPDGTVLAQANSSVHTLDLSSGLSSQAVTFVGCSGPNLTDVSAIVIDGQPFVASVERFDSPTYSGVQIERRFLARAALSGAEAKCEAAVNIPGRPVLVTKTGELLVNDMWVEDVQQLPRRQSEEPSDETNTDRFKFSTTSSLLSLKVAGADAKLVDEEPLKDSYSSHGMTVGGKLARVVSDANGAKLEILSLSPDAELNRNVYRFDLALGKDASLVFVTETASGERLGIVRKNESIQTIKWTDAQPRPSVIKMQMLDPRFDKTMATEVLRLANSWSANDYHYSPSLHTLEVSQGLTGIAQISLTQ